MTVSNCNNKLKYIEYERDYESRCAPQSRYPSTLNHHGASRSGTGSLIGGTHGIGAGTHSFAPDEAGGTFSNLCERRLAFELAQHKAPEQATRSLIHRYTMDSIFC